MRRHAHGSSRKWLGADQSSECALNGARGSSFTSCAYAIAIGLTVVCGAIAALPHDRVEAAEAVSPARADQARVSHLYDPETGYRIKHYRAAVPTEVPGGEVVDIDQIDKLVATANPVFLDVMPSTGFSYHPKTGQWRLSRIHDHIPGSTWLPDVGNGHISPELDAYFQSNLERLTNDAADRAIIIYCQSDCWMAWNAVQRAAKYGYTKLYWYPDGIDGWRDWDRRLVPAVAVPVNVGLPAAADTPAPE